MVFCARRAGGELGGGPDERRRRAEGLGDRRRAHKGGFEVGEGAIEGGAGRSGGAVIDAVKRTG